MILLEVYVQKFKRKVGLTDNFVSLNYNLGLLGTTIILPFVPLAKKDSAFTKSNYVTFLLHS